MSKWLNYSAAPLECYTTSMDQETPLIYENYSYALYITVNTNLMVFSLTWEKSSNLPYIAQISDHLVTTIAHPCIKMTVPFILIFTAIFKIFYIRFK